MKTNTFPSTDHGSLSPRSPRRQAAAAPFAAACLALLLPGCASNNPDARITNARQPGPAIGNAVGAATGAVAGNVAGAVVGVGEGFVSQAGEVFNNDRRVVRQWRTVQTSDGRTIQIPVEVEVDANGVPIAPAQSAAPAAQKTGPR
ncbi:MAG: flagellar motor protein MotB [Opitutaceae bacterium]|jgi:hypothetical protein|nr:flagellar motor protein MotB [Opitutaceae bacterium]